LEQHACKGVSVHKPSLKLQQASSAFVQKVHLPNEGEAWFLRQIQKLGTTAQQRDDWNWISTCKR